MKQFNYFLLLVFCLFAGVAEAKNKLTGTDGGIVGVTPPPGDTAHGLIGYYYNDRTGNTEVFDTLKVTRTDPQINFDWGSGTPFPGQIGIDWFSVRWVGYIRAKVTGIYTFHARSDDGARLIIDNLIVMDYWGTCCKDFTGQIFLEAGELYPIIFEMEEKTGGAAANYLDWEAPGLSRELVPSENLYAIAPPNSELHAALPKPDISRDTTHGLVGYYYDDPLGNRQWFDTLKATRIDPQINFDWGSGVALKGRMTRVDNYSVQWVGFLRAPVTGSYTFTANSDDGGRLIINGNKIIDYWGTCCSDVTGSISLEEGKVYAFVFQMHEIGGGAGAHVRWKVDGAIDDNLIPSSALYTVNVPPVAQTAIFPSEGIYEDSVQITIKTTTEDAIIHYTTDGTTPTAASPVYNGPFYLKKMATVNAFAEHKDMLSSFVVSKQYLVIPPAVSDPAFSPVSGVYDTTQKVSIHTEQTGSEIYYTIDGSDPSASGALLYTQPITVDSTTLIKTFAVNDDYSPSEVSTALFIILKETAEAPEFSVEDGSYTSPQTITITSKTSGATIRYTIDGKSPDISSPIYTQPIQVSNSTTLKAYVEKPGLNSSPVTSATYLINQQLTKVDTPRPSIPPGIYTAVQQVILTTSVRGTTIYYTTDGSEPDENSKIYKTPIAIADSTVLKVFAIKEGMASSPVITLTYVVVHDEASDKPINTRLLPTVLSITPNPANDRARISWEGLIYTRDKIHLVISDNKGAVVYNTDIPAEKAFYEFSTKLFSPGVYFVQVLSGSSAARGKLIVNR